MTFSPYLPPTTSGDASTVFSLLRVLTDPDAAKETLNRMVAEKEAIDEALQKQMLAQAEAQKLHEDAQQKSEAAHKLRAEAEDAYSAAQAKESAVVEREKSLTWREGLLAKEKAAHEKAVVDLRERIAAHDERAKSQAATAKLLKEREEKLAASEKAHRDWLSLKPGGQ